MNYNETRGFHKILKHKVIWDSATPRQTTITSFARKKGDAIKDFLTGVKTLREQARKNMDKGPITESYAADISRVIEVLNQAHTSELVYVRRYQQRHFTAQGFNAEPIAAEFFLHAKEEQTHAERLAGRISQLGGIPDFDPSSLKDRAHSEYRVAQELLDVVKENLAGERIAISSYAETINWLGSANPTTRRILEEILSTEEEHADDMADLLENADLFA